MASRARRRLLAGTLLAVVVALIAGAADAPARSAEKPRNNGQPTITGVAVEGQTITGHNGSWFCNPACVPGGPENRGGYSFQWQRCDAGGSACVDIASAAQQNYVVAAADRGSTLRVAVTATNWDCDVLLIDCRYSSATAFSAVTAVVPGVPPAPPAPPPPPEPDEGPPISNALPVVAGLARQGQTLTASAGDWSGLEPIEYTYRWRRCKAACTLVAGATETTYLVGSADLGATLEVTVTATNELGSATATSAPTAVVTSVPIEAPAAMSPPAVYGTPKQGATLTAVPGAWSGSPAPSFAYGWLRCGREPGACLPIEGADSENYVLRAEDGGRNLRVVVTARNSAGVATATSPPTGVVAPTGLLHLLDGRESVPASTVVPPDRIVVGVRRVRFVGARTLLASAHVTDTRGYVIRGALVSLRPARAGETSSAAATSATSGDASLRFTVSRSKLARGGTLVLLVRASRRGENGQSVATQLRLVLRLRA
jgi:hypothetical protein